MAKKEHKTHSEHSSLVDLNLRLQDKNIELLNAMHALTKRVDSLVSIFEEAAKNVTDVSDDNRVKQLAEKLDSLLDQNKSLANGLLLLERYVRSKSLETPFKKI